MNDILEEAMLRMLVNQNKSSNTRVTGDERQYAAEIIGISALIVADLQQRRSKVWMVVGWNNIDFVCIFMVKNSQVDRF